MSDFEKEAIYFVSLVIENIQKAKESKKRRDEIIFHNVNVSLTGEEVAVYNEEKDMLYEIFTKDVENYNFSIDIKWIILKYIKKLTQYANKEITFEELAEIKYQTPEVVKDILKQEKYISGQLKALRRNRNIPEVQQYIENLEKAPQISKYMLYIIDKYYYGNKNAKKVEKNDLEKFGKLYLR